MSKNVDMMNEIKNFEKNKKETLKCLHEMKEEKKLETF